MLKLIVLFSILIAFSFAQLDPANTNAYGPGLTTTKAGELTFFSLLAKDSSGNNVTICDDIFSDFNVTFTGPTTVSGQVTNCQPPIYSAGYALTIAGTYSLDIQYKGTSIGGTPYTTQCTPGAIYAPNCKSDGINDGVAGYTDYFNITTYDQYNNIITTCQPDPFTVKISTTVPTNGIYVSCNQGIYIYDYSPTQSGGFLVEVEYSGSPISGSPFSISVSTGPISKDTSFAIGSGSVSSTAGLTGTFSIDTNDAYGNNILGCSVPSTDFTAQLIGRSDGEQVPVTFNCLTEYIGTYTTNKSQIYDLFIYYNGDLLLNSPYTVTISPSSISASSTIAGGALNGTIAGTASQISFDTRDIYGNTILTCSTSEYNNFRIVLTGPTNYNGIVGSCTNGTYFGQYNPIVKGLYSMSLTYKNDPVNGSPFSPYVSPSAISPANSFATGSGFAASTAGVLTTFQIVTYDQYLNGIETCVSDFSAFVVELYLNDLNMQNATIVSCNNGTYQVQYTLTVSGAWFIEVSYLSIPLSNSPKYVIISPAPPVGNSCYVYGQSSTGVAGQTNSFSLRCNDTFGNVVTQCYPNGNWIIEVTGAQSLTGNINGCAGGIYNSSWVTNISGQYSVNVNYVGENIVGVPFNTLIAPGALAPDQTYASGLGVQKEGVRVGLPSEILIHSQDIFGNNVTTCDPFPYNEWAITISGSETIPISIFNCLDGVYHANYTPTVVGTLNIDITSYGEPIIGSTFSVNVRAGLLFASTSSASGIGLTNGVAGNLNYFHIITRDEHNNLITNCEDVENWNEWEIILSNPLLNVTGNIISCANGLLQVQYSTTLAANFTLDVKYGGVEISGSPFSVEIVPNILSAVHSYVVDVQEEGEAGVTNYFNIIGMDAFGNNQTTCISDNTKFSILFSQYESSNTVVGRVLSCTNGVYHASWSTTVAAEYSGNVEYEGIKLENVPFNVTIKAGPIDASQTKAEGEGVEKVVAGKNTTFSIFSMDSFSNLISLCHDFSIFNVSIFHTSLPVSPLYLGCDNGVYTVGYVTYTAEIFNVGVELNWTDIKGSVYNVECVAGELDPTKCHAEGLALSYVIVGENSPFNVSCTDLFGNKVTLCESNENDFEVTMTPSNGFEYNYTSCERGDYQFEYILDLIGNYSLHISYSNVSIINSPFSVVATSGDISASQSYATGSGVSNNVATVLDNAYINIIAVNRYGFRIRECEEEPYSNLFQVNQNNLEWVGCSEGNYTAFYTTQSAGPRTVSVSYNGTQIKGSPYQASIKWGPIYANNTIVEFNHTGVFEITGYDIYKNLVNEQTTSFNYLVGPNCLGNVHTSLRYISNGRYEANYTVPSAGTYCVEIFYITQKINNTQSSSNGIFSMRTLQGTSCSGCQGACIDGKCYCESGFEGDNCEKAIKRGLSGGIIALIVLLCSFALFFVGLIVGWFVNKKRAGYQQI